MQRMSTWGVIALTAAGLLGGAASVAAETVEEVLACHVATRGGLERLQAVRSVRATGTAVFGGGVEAPFAYEWKYPDRFRFELTMQGVTSVQAFDGEQGWEIDPPEQPQPVPMAGLDLALLNDASNFTGLLVDPQARGAEVTLVGKREVEGTEAWELAVTRRDGGSERSYLDTEHCLEFQQVESYPTPGGSELEMVVTWGDYKEVAGVLLPHSWARGQQGGGVALSLLFTTMEVNPELADSRFAMAADDGS